MATARTDLVCRGCGREIQGQYVVALGADWHPGCFRCAGCGQMIGEASFAERDGRPFHAACYHLRFSPRCAGCNQPIEGNYTTALGKPWHPEHFVCARCKRPFKATQFYQRDGQAFCEDCFHEQYSPRCAVCGRPMVGRYLTDAWGDSFCATHQGELPECASCGRPVCERLTGGGVRYADGRTLCNLCRKTAIDKDIQATAPFIAVRRALAALGIDLGNAPTPVHMVDRAELARLSTKKYAHDPAGMTLTHSTTLDGQVVRRDIDKILILHGLAQEHLQAIAAHEIGHAWLFMSGMPELRPQIEEGVCEYCAYLWLEQQHTDAAAYRMRLMEQNSDPIYGDGFRAVRDACKTRSLPALVAYLAKHKRMP